MMSAVLGLEEEIERAVSVAEIEVSPSEISSDPLGDLLGSQRFAIAISGSQPVHRFIRVLTLKSGPAYVHFCNRSAKRILLSILERKGIQKRMASFEQFPLIHGQYPARVQDVSTRGDGANVAE